MAESNADLTFGFYSVEAPNGSNNDNKRSLSPREDYNPLEGCTDVSEDHKVGSYQDFEKPELVEADDDSEYYTSSLEYDPGSDQLIVGTPQTPERNGE